MTKYKCGHTSNFIITDASITTISAWISWKNTVGFDGDKSMCWACWCKELREERASRFKNEAAR